MRTHLRAAFVLLIGVLLGALRDLLFINLNYQIDHVRRATSTSYAHSRFRSLVNGWTLGDLLLLKWLLAGFFILCMWALCMLLLRNASTFRLARPISLIFLAIALLAALLSGLAHWFPVEEAAVNLLHAIQYPVLLVVVQLAILLLPGTRAERP